MTDRTVELYVDPVCPFAWMTSRWLLHAAEVRDIRPTFSVMSLSVLNEDQDIDEDYRAMLQRAWGPARLAIEIHRSHGADAFARWYTAWGERFHVAGDKDVDGYLGELLEQSGLPASLLDAAAPVPGDETDRALRASHQTAISAVGQDVGTPVISFGEGTAYFGPVVSPAPKGEDAGRLLDALTTMAQLEGFYELKRSRTDGIDLS